MRSDSWRERVDKLLMMTAGNACEGRWANAETYHHLPNKSTADLVEFQVAALRAFLASLVSPSRARPAYLAEGFELFQTGKLNVVGMSYTTQLSLRHCKYLMLDFEQVSLRER